MIDVICPILVARWAGGQDLAEVSFVTKGERFRVIAECEDYGSERREKKCVFSHKVELWLLMYSLLLSVFEPPLMVGQIQQTLGRPKT